MPRSMPRSWQYPEAVIKPVAVHRVARLAIGGMTAKDVRVSPSPRRGEGWGEGEPFRSGATPSPGRCASDLSPPGRGERPRSSRVDPCRAIPGGGR